MLEEDVKRNVVDQLAWDDRVDASKVGVAVDGGTVVLSGSVATPFARQAATQDARVVLGVAAVDNQLVVDMVEPVPPAPELEERMRRVLDWNPAIDSERITLSHQNGVVTVSGSVDALWKKFEVEYRLLDIAGVLGVVNELTVVPTQSINDELIANDIRAVIDRRIDIDIEDVDIKVEDGVVTLTGTVPTWTARSAAMEAASYTIGVTAVIDNLIVTAP
jgi:osmotically-inducible protein OsmY